MESVEYREIEGHPAYRVGSDGSIWSRRKPGYTKTVWDSWHEIKCTIDDGYKIARMDGKKYRVHTLVLNAFTGPRPAGMQGRHLNGIKTDNRRDNLKWGTPKENSEDSVKHGHTSRGSHRPKSKLSEENVREIRALVAAGGISKCAIARKFGISEATVRDIMSRRLWKHLDWGVK